MHDDELECEEYCEKCCDLREKACEEHDSNNELKDTEVPHEEKTVRKIGKRKNGSEFMTSADVSNAEVHENYPDEYAKDGICEEREELYRKDVEHGAPCHVQCIMADTMGVHVILENVRSAHNVGSIFRTVDGAGVRKLYLAGYTPAPIDRFGRERAPLAKTALGATKTVSYEPVDDIGALIRRLKKEGVTIVAVEQGTGAIDYREKTLPSNVAFVFGNEVTGVSAGVLQEADHVIHIPLVGAKESLNVSVCAGIILFHFRPKRGPYSRP